ncbi:hypothetical protein TNCV_5112931 [Trichonephila clavipes]|nr:hypothetical protein TNCV_5112931 [Trichonephila clavipes]
MAKFYRAFELQLPLRDYTPKFHATPLSCRLLVIASCHEATPDQNKGEPPMQNVQGGTQLPFSRIKSIGGTGNLYMIGTMCRFITQLISILSPQCLQTRIRRSWCSRQMRDSSVKTTSFHSAPYILLSSHHWRRRRLWLRVKGRPSNELLADRSLFCKRRRMVRADIE